MGSCGVQEEDLADGMGVRLIAYFDSSYDRCAIVTHLSADLDAVGVSAEFHVDDVPAVDWATSWRSHFEPVYPTPKMVVCPPWNRVPDPPGGFAITIDPQMAFGTGHHETTRLALLGLEQRVMAGERVLDVGTGSGILSIAAAKMGAAHVMAIDIEAPAIENARLNCDVNGVSDRVVLAQHSVDAVSDVFHVVVANMISSILFPMMFALTERIQPGGCAILGGVLDREQDAFENTLGNVGLGIDEMLHDGEWVCAIASKE
jgi:ribosomal protein L11 methyltransferase